MQNANPKMKKLFCLIVCLISFLAMTNAEQSFILERETMKKTVSPTFFQTDIFISGQDGYHTYRIPSIVIAPNNTILAFCEGRKLNNKDSGDINLLMKSSSDGGKTWSEQKVIWDDDTNTCGNPCPVVDKDTGIIWLLMTHNLGPDTEKQIKGEKAAHSRTVWVSQSNDNGLSWTKPLQITDTIKKTGWNWYATGPGAGIQLKTGRLIVPCVHSETGKKESYSHVIYSDDHGKSWLLGGSTPEPNNNECEVVELTDGTLLLNMRNYNRIYTCRSISKSQDSGSTWSPNSYDTALIEPICQASIRRFTMEPKPNRILFSNPAHVDKRRNMTVRLSYDECKTWQVEKQIFPGPSAYSCLAVFNEDIMLCYECGETHAMEKITFAKFNIEWLTDNKDNY